MKTEEKIDKYLKESNIFLNENIFDMKGIAKSGGKNYKIILPVSAKDEKEAKEKFKDMVDRHIKNGHFPKDTKKLNKEDYNGK